MVDLALLDVVGEAPCVKEVLKLSLRVVKHRGHAGSAGGPDEAGNRG